MMFDIHLIDDFRSKYFKFWSTRLYAIAQVCSMLEILNTLGPLFFPAIERFAQPGTMAIISFVFGAAGMLARGIKQVWPEIETLPVLPPDQVKGEGAWPDVWTYSADTKEADIKQAYPGASDDKAAY